MGKLLIWISSAVYILRYMLGAACVGCLLVGSIAHAQDTSSIVQSQGTDLTKITCADVFPNGVYNISEQNQKEFLSLVFWLAGFESGEKNSTLVDITRIQEISRVLLSACASNSNKSCFEIVHEHQSYKSARKNPSKLQIE